MSAYHFDDALFGPSITHLLAHARPAPGEDVLDLASGSAIVGRRAATIIGPDGHMTSLDIGPNILRKARSLHNATTPAAWVRGDAVHLPFAARAFDLVLCHQGLQFFSDRAGAARELRRVLREGGRAAIMTWTRLEDCPFYHALHEAITIHLGDGAAGFVRQPFSLPGADELREVLGTAFTEVTTTRLEVTTVHPSVAAFATFFLSYMPKRLAARKEVANATPAIVRQMEDALAPWCADGELQATIPAHITSCR